MSCVQTKMSPLASYCEHGAVMFSRTPLKATTAIGAELLTHLSDLLGDLAECRVYSNCPEHDLSLCTETGPWAMAMVRESHKESSQSMIARKLSNWIAVCCARQIVADSGRALGPWRSFLAYTWSFSAYSPFSYSPFRCSDVLSHCNQIFNV